MLTLLKSPTNLSIKSSLLKFIVFNRAIFSSADNSHKIRGKIFQISKELFWEVLVRVFIIYYKITYNRSIGNILLICKITQSCTGLFRYGLCCQKKINCIANSVGFFIANLRICELSIASQSSCPEGTNLPTAAATPAAAGS